ncbi:hypothetical protein PMIN06_013103 [Paraphaeosphaeria minitans]
MLQKLSIYVGGPAFATPARLQHLWEGDGHEITRLCRQISPDAAQADREAYSADTIQGQGQFYGEQLQLMRYALVSLTHLDYVVSDEDKLEGCLGIAGNLVTGFLIATEKLEDLRLVFGRLVNSVFQPLSGYDERNRSQGSIRLLENLTLYSPWTAIRRVELEIATDKDTLLHLTRMTLVRLGDPLNNWELALTEIGQGLSLTSLALSDLFDFTEEWGRGVQGRMLFKSEDSMWQGMAGKYSAYYEVIIGRVLRQETILSLSPVIS